MEEYELSDLICRRVTDRGADRKCVSDIGKRIVRNLIRVAASKIFSDEARSFVELVVNSIDATRVKYGITNTVGKFGFGFYSILGLIIGYPERSIIIESRYMKEGKIYGYNATLRDRGTNSKDINIYLSLRRTPFIGNSTGTTIHVNWGKMDDGVFCGRIINSIRSSVREVRDVSIQMSIDTTCRNYASPKTLVNNYDKNSIIPFSEGINISIFNGGGTITDRGIGISDDVLFNILLVPSISSKRSPTIQNIETNYANRTGLINKWGNLVITVNDITVFKGTHNTCDAYLLSMPPDTQVPLARNDIIISSPRIHDIFSNNLRLLIGETIRQTNDLSYLWSELRFYIKNSMNEENRNVVESVMSETERRQDIIFIPYGNSLYDQLSILTGRKFVVLPNSNIGRVEDFLISAMREYNHRDIYWGKNVYLVNGIKDNITSGGLNSAIFINNEYALRNQSWTVDLALSYKGDRLYPYTAPTILNTHSEYINKIFEKDRKLLNEYYTEIASIYLAMLSGLANFTNKNIPMIMEYVVDDIMNLSFNGFDHEQMLTCLRAIYGVFSNTKSKQGYGNASYFTRVEPVLHALYAWETTPVNPGNIQRDLDTVLFLCNTAQLNGNTYITVSSSLRSQYKIIQLPTAVTAIITFCDSNNVTIIEELIIRGFCKFYVNQHAPRGINAMTESARFVSNTNTLMFILHEIRRKFDPDTLDNWLNTYIRMSYNAIKVLIYEPLEIALNLHRDILHTNHNPMMNKITNITPIQFTGKQLFNSVFSNETDITNSGNYPNETPFQIFEIIINEGTTKDYVPAILTELSQNSIDAVRSSPFPINHSIDVGFSNDPYPVIFFQDYVGIEPNNLIYLLLPFLSTKTADAATNTGEMGTGFFNLYRQPYCDYVIIQTIKNNIQTTIVGKPIINNDRVIDINYYIYFDNVENDNGTIIAIYLKNSFESIFTDVSLFVNDVLINTEFPIRFNNNFKHRTTETIFEDNSVTLRYGTDFVSQIFTNGVPFNAINSYPGIYPELTTYIPTGFILDIKKGFYQGVQSRTEIIGFKNLSNYLVLAIAHLISINKYPPMVANALLPFVNTKFNYQYCMINSVDTGTSSILNLKLHVLRNNRAHTFPSIIECINKICVNISPRLPSQDLIIDNLPLGYPLPAVNCILKWFDNKNVPPPATTTANYNTSTIRYLQLFANIYWQLGSDLERTGKLVGTRFLSNPNPPTILIKDINGASGLYDKKDHTIYLSKLYADETAINQSLGKLFIITDGTTRQLAIREDPVLFQTFGITSPLNTLLHELTHAHRNDTHAAIHDGINMTINGVYKYYDFDDGGSAVASLIAENGLYLQLTQ